MKEKLTELIEEAYYCSIEKLVDHLIARGVTLDDQVSSSKWIPVSERLPEKYEPVLVYDQSVYHGQYVMAASWYEGRWMTEFDFDYFENPGITHWMPLPEPPKGE